MTHKRLCTIVGTTTPVPAFAGMTKLFYRTEPDGYSVPVRETFRETLRDSCLRAGGADSACIF